MRFFEISYLGFLLQFVNTLKFWIQLIKNSGFFFVNTVVQLYITIADLYN